MLRYLLNRLMARDVINHINAKQRRLESQRLLEERLSEQEYTLMMNRDKLRKQINAANAFLSVEVQLEQLADSKMAAIKEFFDYNGKSGHYLGLFLTTPQKEELKKRLNLRPADYVPNGFVSRRCDEGSTIAFIIENTDTFKLVWQKMALKRYRLYVDASMATIYFCLVYE